MTCVPKYDVLYNQTLLNNNTCEYKRVSFSKYLTETWLTLVHVLLPYFYKIWNPNEELSVEKWHWIEHVYVVSYRCPLIIVAVLGIIPPRHTITPSSPFLYKVKNSAPDL